MKITPIKPIEPITRISRNGGSSETGTSYIAVDRLELSSEGRTMSKVYQIVPEEDEARKEKIEALKKKVKEGLYEVNENMVNVIITSMVGHTA